MPDREDHQVLRRIPEIAGVARDDCSDLQQRRSSKGTKVGGAGMANADPERALPIEERLRLAATFADRARVMFEMWQLAGTGEGGIFDPASRLHLVADFVRWNRHAHLTACVAYVGILYDEDRRSISLPNLFRELGERPGARQTYLLEAERLCRGTFLARRRIRILRNKLVAHRDRDLSSAGAFARARLTVGSLAALLDTSCMIADRLLQAIDLPAVSRSLEPLKQMQSAYGALRIAE